MRKLTLFAVLISLISFSAMAQPTWRVLPEKSGITFTADYGGQAVSGKFPAFTADIQFDPAHPQQGKVKAVIDITKLHSDDKDAQADLPKPEWLDAQKFPKAVFVAERFKRIEDKQYEASGTLAIRDKTVPVTLPFTLETFKGDGPDAGKTFARMNGTLTLKRLDFGIGQGDWADTSTVKNEVKVEVKLEAVTL
jgi:polyisoprenoid-binding protein YceI